MRKREKENEKKLKHVLHEGHEFQHLTQHTHIYLTLNYLYSRINITIANTQREGERVACIITNYHYS